MTRLISFLSITSLVFAACASEDKEPNPNPNNSTDNGSRALRTSEAASEVITLSADFAGVAGSAARSSIAEVDLKKAIDDIVGADCGLVELTADTLFVDLSDCPGLTGTIEVTFPNADCFDPTNIDPECLGDLDVSVTTALEIDGIDITGTFANLISEDGCDAEGSLEVDGDGDELDVDFDISVIDDDETGCELINGTLDVASSDGAVSVTADGLLDCGDCPEAGSLTVVAGDESISVDFDDGLIEVSGPGGEALDIALSCDDAI